MLKNQNGMTLVEILAALTILSIVLISFTMIFLQSSYFTAHNKESLTMIQLGEEIVGDIRADYSFKNLVGIKKDGVEVDLTRPFINLNDGEYIYHPPLTDYKVTINLKPGLISGYLKRAEIKITTVNSNQKAFETEMYIEVGLWKMKKALHW